MCGNLGLDSRCFITKTVIFFFFKLPWVFKFLLFLNSLPDLTKECLWIQRYVNWTRVCSHLSHSNHSVSVVKAGQCLIIPYFEFIAKLDVREVKSVQRLKSLWGVPLLNGEWLWQWTAFCFVCVSMVCGTTCIHWELDFYQKCFFITKINCKWTNREIILNYAE